METRVVGQRRWHSSISVHMLNVRRPAVALSLAGKKWGSKQGGSAVTHRGVLPPAQDGPGSPQQQAQQGGTKDKTVQLSCKHLFHDECIRGRSASLNTHAVQRSAALLQAAVP